jgi:uncharacterized OB-fold protein
MRNKTERSDDMGAEKKRTALREGMWTTKPDGDARLLGSKCSSCGELFFPKKESGICVHCQHEGLEGVELGPFGRIVSYTAVMQPPAGGYYHGQVPYNFGLVDLDDGVRIETHLGGDFEKLKVGMRVKLAIDTLYTDADGNEVQAYRFLPAEE